MMSDRTTRAPILAAAAAAILFSGAAFAQNDCGDVSEYYRDPQISLPHTSFAVKKDVKLDVLFLSGSPSQTGATKGLRSYPSYFEAALQERLPGVELRVSVRAAPRRSVVELLPKLPPLLDELKPALVVWQAGTADAFRAVGPEDFSRALESGIAEIVRRGADVVLVDMQYSPRTDLLIDSAAYVDAMRRVADTMDAGFFSRYEIMRRWNEDGIFDLSSLRDDGLYEKIHLCIGRLLADYVTGGAALKDFKGKGQ